MPSPTSGGGGPSLGAPPAPYQTEEEIAANEAYREDEEFLETVPDADELASLVKTAEELEIAAADAEAIAAYPDATLEEKDAAVAAREAATDARAAANEANDKYNASGAVQDRVNEADANRVPDEMGKGFDPNAPLEPPGEREVEPERDPGYYAEAISQAEAEWQASGLPQWEQYYDEANKRYKFGAQSNAGWFGGNRAAAASRFSSDMAVGQAEARQNLRQQEIENYFKSKGVDIDYARLSEETRQFDVNQSNWMLKFTTDQENWERTFAEDVKNTDWAHDFTLNQFKESIRQFDLTNANDIKKLEIMRDELILKRDALEEEKRKNKQAEKYDEAEAIAGMIGAIGGLLTGVGAL